jgi:hypothetical protein
MVHDLNLIVSEHIETGSGSGTVNNSELLISAIENSRV